MPDSFSDKQLDQLQSIISGTVMSLWSDVFFPQIKETFATKQEMNQKFDDFDLKMQKRFLAAEKRMDRMEMTFNLRMQKLDEKILEQGEKITGIQGNLIRIEEKLDGHIRDTDGRLNAHTEAIRQIRGVSDKGKEHYQIKFKTKK